MLNTLYVSSVLKHFRLQILFTLTPLLVDHLFLLTTPFFPVSSCPMRVIQSDIPLGTLAAILTALEYVLSILSGLSARAAVHGCWLVSLHKKNKGHITGHQKERRTLVKDFIAFAMGVWLVIGVALVESNLQYGVRVLTEPQNSTLCVSMFGRYMPDRISMHRPPYRTNIESWIMKVAHDIDCKYGIASVGVGGITNTEGENTNMSAPICAKSPVDVKGGEAVAWLGKLNVLPGGFTPVLGESAGYLLFPYNGSNMGGDKIEKTTQYEKLDTKGPCFLRGINDFPTVIYTSFSTLKVGFTNLTGTVQNALCEAHGSRPVVTLPPHIMKVCVEVFAITVSKCLHARGITKYIYSSILHDVGVLTIGKNITDPSYACWSVSVEITYFFIDASYIQLPYGKPTGTLPALTPVALKVIRGECERTVAALAQAALLYTADSEWSHDNYETLPRQVRYYANMMAVSASQYPLHTISGIETARDNGDCFLRPVKKVTEIPVDWRFGILLSGLVIVFLVAIIAITFRMVFSSEVWCVGSSKWSLTKLLSGIGADAPSSNEAVVEVITIDEEMQEEQRQRTTDNLPRRKSHGASMNPFNRGRMDKPVERLEYRVRTVCTKSSINECSRPYDEKTSNIHHA